MYNRALYAQNADAFVKFYPAVPNAIYRFRARAMNAHGWGDWSGFASFDYGKYTGKRPGAQSPPEDGGTSTGSVPENLSPDGGTVSTASVTLSCSAVTSATEYQFAIESQSASSYVPYYTYTTAKTSQAFYPQTPNIGYRWRARAMVGGAYGAWSPYATFQYQ